MVIEDAPTMDVRAASIALDALASEIEHLQAIVAVHLTNRRIDGCWERSDTSTNLEELATVVASIYASCDGALDGWRAPEITLETEPSTILLRRSGEHVVASVFDPSAPLGLLRLSSAKIVDAIASQLDVLSRRMPSAPPEVAPPTRRPSTLPPAPPSSSPPEAPTSRPPEGSSPPAPLSSTSRPPAPPPAHDPDALPVTPRSTPPPSVMARAVASTSSPSQSTPTSPARHHIMTEDTADSPAGPSATPRDSQPERESVSLNQTLMAGQVPEVRVDDTPKTPATSAVEPRATMPSAEPDDPPDSEGGVETVHYGRDLAEPERTSPSLTDETDDVAKRTIRLLEFLEARAPEPHIVKLRIALRAGLSLVALDHPETLGEDALVLIETAVEDILGIDRSELAEAL